MMSGSSVMRQSPHPSGEGLSAYLPAASSMTLTTTSGCDRNTVWLEPGTVVTLALARLYIQRCRSMLMVLSAPGSTAQEGLVFHAAAFAGVPKASTDKITCERAMKDASAGDESAAKFSRNFVGSM